MDMAYLCQAHNTIGKLSYELIRYCWADIDSLPHLHRFHYEAILQARLLVEQQHV
jgi:hypothetical protein